jgi:putative Mg2+ transporter-C (MgtC) family protein
MAAFDGLWTPHSLQLAGEVLAKLGVGALLGGLIGWEREKHGRPAGIRTHMLMVIGVILFSEAGKYFGGVSDPSRVAAQIVTGVGFLGAGTIMRIGPEIRGLTTAASIWAAAAIGMAISVGGSFMLVAIAATVLALFTLIVVDRLEFRYLKPYLVKTLRLKLAHREVLFQVADRISQTAGCHLVGVRVAEDTPEPTVDLDFKGETELLLEKTLGLEGVQSAAWTEP